MDEGVALLELARNAQRLFAKQEPREKRRLLNFVLSNCTWEDGEVVATFRQPFDILAETQPLSLRIEARRKRANSAKSEIWLPGSDSNQRPAVSRDSITFVTLMWRLSGREPLFRRAQSKPPICTGERHFSAEARLYPACVTASVTPCHEDCQHRMIFSDTLRTQVIASRTVRIGRLQPPEFT